MKYKPDMYESKEKKEQASSVKVVGCYFRQECFPRIKFKPLKNHVWSTLIRNVVKFQ